MTIRSHKPGSLIAAVSTPAGRGAIAIVRLSGENALQTAARLFGKNAEKLQRRYMYYGTLAAADGIRDAAMLVLFDGDSSYTGEEAAEIHCHGSPVITAAILKRLCDEGARIAERGEFTRRAYLNGKLDLTQAEGIIDLIDSGSTAAAVAAYTQAEGALYREISALAEQLTDAAAALGAAIDYPEEIEEDLPDLGLDAILARLEKLQQSYTAGSAAVDGVRVTLFGKPNAGKSTLFNALLGYDRSIVTDIPGTTRDTVSESYEYKGVRFCLTDTAGIREARDEPERQGILRSQKAAQTADVVLEIDETGTFVRPDAIHVLSKKDTQKKDVACDAAVAAVTGDGIETLKELIYQKAGNLQLSDVLLTNLRQYEAVSEAKRAVEGAILALTDATADCAAVELNNALRYLGTVTGICAEQATVNRIFERFCVGK